MRQVLDFLYSDNIVMTIVLMVVMFLCVGFAFLNPFKNKVANYIYKGGLYVFAFVFFMSFNFFYYGYSESFERIYIGKTRICLVESYERGGEGPSENVVRLHIIDKTTGEFKERYYIGAYGDIVGMRNDTLCYMNNHDVVLFDTESLKEIYFIKEDEWGAISPEFKVGMKSVSSNQNSDSPLRPFIKLQCKNGKAYTFDPFSKQILDKNPGDIYLKEFSKEKYEITVQTAPGKTIYYMTTVSLSGGNLEMVLPTSYSEKMFQVKDSTGYIDPFIMCMDTLKKFFVFGYYTTTDKKDFIIEAKDFNYKALWKKDPVEMEAMDRHNVSHSDVWKYKDEVLYFNCGGFVIAIEPFTGKILWRTRL